MIMIIITIMITTITMLMMIAKISIKRDNDDYGECAAVVITLIILCTRIYPGLTSVYYAHTHTHFDLWAWLAHT